MDQERIARAVAEIIASLGENGEREGLRDTPRRIAEMYAELFAGLGEDPVAVLKTGYVEDEHREMVVLKDIPFYSMCEHHLLPFHGLAHVGYIPRGRIVGVSKLARMVEILARRPQVQERLVSQIADALVEGANPLGVAVVIEAEHLCITMRGVQKPGSKMVTSALRGAFRDRPDTRNEFFAVLGGDKHH